MREKNFEQLIYLSDVLVLAIGFKPVLPNRKRYLFLCLLHEIKQFLLQLFLIRINDDAQIIVFKS